MLKRSPGIKGTFTVDEWTPTTSTSISSEAGSPHVKQLTKGLASNPAMQQNGAPLFESWILRRDESLRHLKVAITWRYHTAGGRKERIVGTSKLCKKTSLSINMATNFQLRFPVFYHKLLRIPILVTRELGFRYLWNASLCIVQDDKRDRHVQVLRMDGIYSSAVLTIAAATGSHANSGIAGISRPRTLRQKTENVNGLHLALAMPNHGSTQTDPHWYGTAGLGLFRKKSCPRDCFYSQIVRCISSAQTQSGAKTLSLRRTTARRAGARSGCRYDGQPTGRPENSVWRTTSP